MNSSIEPSNKNKKPLMNSSIEPSNAQLD